MQDVVLILIFVAMLLAFVVLVVRTARFETYLKELESLKYLNENIKKFVDAQAKLNTARMEEYLLELKEDAGRIVELLEGFRKSEEERAREGNKMDLESVLLGMGYSKIKIIGELDGTGAPGLKEVQVECVKGDIVHKGTVTIDSGRVVDCRLKPAYEVFP